MRLTLLLNKASRRNVGGLERVFALRHVTENGVEKLKIQFVKQGSLKPNDTTTEQPVSINGFSLPYGNYTLIKEKNSTNSRLLGFFFYYCFLNTNRSDSKLNTCTHKHKWNRVSRQFVSFYFAGLSRRFRVLSFTSP